MADKPVSFGLNDARRIDRVVSSVERDIIDAREPRKRMQYPQGGAANASQGRLLSAMLACDNALTGAVTFTYVRYVPDGDIEPQTDPVTMKEEVDDDDVIVETTGVNRSPLEASIDGHVVCVRINGENVPVLVFDVCPE